MRTPGDELPSSDRTARIVGGAFVYFLLVMTAGFIFGAVRELLFVPMFGRAIGEPLETPFMLAAIFASAWLVTSCLLVRCSRAQCLAMGVLSLAFVLTAELGLSPWIRGSIQGWFDSFTPLTLSLAIMLWIAHVIAPSLNRQL